MENIQHEFDSIIALPTVKIQTGKTVVILDTSGASAPYGSTGKVESVKYGMVSGQLITGAWAGQRFECRVSDVAHYILKGRREEYWG